MRRAWTADSWTVGIVKPAWCWSGLVKRRCGEGRLVAEVREIREKKTVEGCMMPDRLRGAV